MTFITKRIKEWRFDRDHRPYLETRLPEPTRLPDGRLFQPGLELIYCTKHECWFHECPKT